MALDPNTLPDDPVLLRGVISQLLGAVEKLERKNAWLQAEVEALFRKLFRQRTEKLDPRQLELVFEAMRDLGIPQGQLEQLEQEVPRQGTSARLLWSSAVAQGSAAGTHRACLARAGALLHGVWRRAHEDPRGGHGAARLHPGLFQDHRARARVFACKSCEETMVRAPKPAQAIEKGLPGPGLLAQVVVSKFAVHQPLYRQAQIYGRHGVTLSRSTLCDWIAETAELVSPLVDWMRRDLLRSRIVQTDDTPVTVLDDQGGTHKGRLWVYLGDRGHPHIVYDYTPTREGSGPTRFLNGFRGYLTGRRLFGVRRALCLRLGPRGRMLDPCSSLLSRGRDRRWGHTWLRGIGVHSSALCSGTRGQRKGS